MPIGTAPAPDVYKRQPYGWVEDFARGLVDGVRACGAEDCTIAGGDMGASGEISVTVTALGRTDRPVLRSGAQAGDTLALAGRTGWADAGLRLLLNPLSRPAMVLLKGIANGGLSHDPLPEIPLSEGCLLYTSGSARETGSHELLWTNPGTEPRVHPLTHRGIHCDSRRG